MENGKLSIMYQSRFTHQTVSVEVWSRCWSAKKTERLSFYGSLTRGVWIGILPSDYQMYPCSSLCLNDIDSTDGRASLTFIGFVISECICLFHVCQKGTTNKQDIQVVFRGRHINDDAAFRVRTNTQKWTSGCAEPSDGTTKCPYVKDQGRLSRCSLWASPAPNSCCYTLWCSIEMWAALLIARLLASSLMAHCSFHDLSSPKRWGCDVAPLALFQDL